MPSIKIIKGELADSQRDDRVVPYKLYYPENIDRPPVIIWSHGFGGSRDGAAFLSRYLAEQGFALFHLTHIGTDTSLWEGKPGHPWDILRKAKIDRAVTVNRFKDIPFVIDRLETLDIPLDNENIGMSGHSFGALSTQVACGQLFPDADNILKSYADSRIAAGIAYSPVPIDHLGPDNVEGDAMDERIYNEISKPILYMTGTDDTAPIGGAPYTHRFTVFENTGAKDKYLLVKNGGDHMVYNGTRGKLGDQDNRERLEDMIKTFSYHFWNAYLRGDNDSLAWLNGQGARNYLKNDGDFTHPSSAA